VEVSLQMLAALKEMHDLNYVHRDVKTDNFMVDNHVVKVIDFGLTTEFIKNGVHGQHQPMGGF
jgi:serine/threonine protein kinase